jgi:hypothetical protein
MRREERSRVFNEGMAAGKAEARAEVERLRAALYAIRGAAVYGPSTDETRKTILRYVDDVLPPSN